MSKARELLAQVVSETDIVKFGSLLSEIRAFLSTPRSEFVRLSEEEIETAQEIAGRNFRRYQSSIRGQLLMPEDGFDFWLIRAIEDALEEKNK